MRLARLTITLTILSLANALAQPIRAVDRSADQTKILAEIEAISRGYVGRDPKPFEDIYLENYVSIRERPSYNTRDQLIAMMKVDSVLMRAGRKLDFETILYETEDPKIRFYGRTAIVVSTKKNFWQYKSQKCLTRTFVTELWVKPENRWKLAAGHATTFQCEPKPFHPMHSAVATVPTRYKPSANTDAASEFQVREIVNSLSQAKSNSAKAFENALERFIAKDFSAVNLNGEIVRDRTILSGISLPPSTRQPGIRAADEALVVFPEAAVHTFKVRPAAGSPAGEVPKQCSVFFAKTEEQWSIVAVHVSKLVAD